MTLRFAEDRTGVEWFEEGVENWHPRFSTVGSKLPTCFDAYARILHPFWTSEGECGQVPVPWADVMRDGDTIYRIAMSVIDEQSGRVPPRPGVHYPYDGALSEAQCHTIVPLLGAATRTSDDCIFGMWDGWGELWPSAFSRGTLHEESPCGFPEPLGVDPPRLHIPDRDFLLYRGTLDDIFGFQIHERFRPANVWWPADRSWAIHSEIDDFWTLVAGTRALIESLHGVEGLEVVDTALSEG